MIALHYLSKEKDTMENMFSKVPIRKQMGKVKVSKPSQKQSLFILLGLIYSSE